MAAGRRLPYEKFPFDPSNGHVVRETSQAIDCIITGQVITSLSTGKHQRLTGGMEIFRFSRHSKNMNRPGELIDILAGYQRTGKSSSKESQ
jgi:hypothetical protein